MRIENEIKLDYKDVLIRPKRSTLKSRKEVDLYRSYKFRNSKQSWTGIPIMSSNMDGVGTFEMAFSLSNLGLFTCLTKHYTAKEWHNCWMGNPEMSAVSVGTNRKEYEKTKEIIASMGLSWVCIDIANGYSEHFVDFVREVRKDLPDISIIAGNVVTADMTQELILAGADVVKVGIGPGSVCTTRIQTGVGYPQLSAVIECADAAHGLGGHIIADGGCTCPGDVAKAFGAGADFVMLGGMLAGHDEGGGMVNVKSGTVQFYGMSSDRAREKHGRRKDGYRGNEGRLISLPYRGPVKSTVEDILGGIRSACTYIGARRLKDMPKCASFVTTNNVINRVYEQYTK